MEADIKMDKLEREIKQSVLEITKNFKHLLKDAIATIKLDVNLNKGNSDLTCMNCTTNDHMQDKCKAILTEQVNAFALSTFPSIPLFQSFSLLDLLVHVLSLSLSLSFPPSTTLSPLNCSASFSSLL